MDMDNPLLANLGRLHTTELGALRIKNNLSLTDEDEVKWCRSQISVPGTIITRSGKNWYADTGSSIITVNVRSYTIITAHKKK